MAEYTTQQYIDSLKKDRKVLVDNLVSKGIEANESETFTTLAPKVANIGDVSIDDCSYFFANGARVNEFLNNPSLFSTLKLKNTYKMFNSLPYYIKSNWYNLINKLPFDNNSSVNGLFSGSGITTIHNLWSTNIRNVTNLSGLFIGAGADNINVSDFNTSNVTSMTYMFASIGYRDYNIIGLENLDTSSVTNMVDMFFQFRTNQAEFSLNYNTSSVTNMVSMFTSMYAPNILTFDISNFDVSNVTNMTYMFKNIHVNNLPLLDISNFTTYNIVDCSGMFDSLNSSNLTEIKFPNRFSIGESSFMFNNINLPKLLNFDISNFDFSNVVNARYMFNSMSLPNVSSVNFGDLNFNNVYELSFSFANLKMPLITSLGIENWKLNNVTKMESAFASMECPNLTILNLSNWQPNTAANLYISNMFYNSKYLTEIDISNFVSSRDTSFVGMFYNCANLQKCDVRGLNLPQWNASGLRNTFTGVPSNCTIIVGNTNVKSFVQQIYPNLTNIVTADEYDNM